jgi:hypothetical protein
MKYSAAAATARSLIGRKGALTTFTREVVGAFNPVTQASTTTTTTFSLPAVGIPPGRSAEFRIGSLERRNLIELHIAPSGGMTPQPGDKVRWAGADWSVIWANNLDPAADGAPYSLAYAER